MKLSEFRQKIAYEKNPSLNFKNTDSRVKDLELILDVVKNMNSSLILDDVLESVLTYAIRVTDSERGFIVLKNNENKLEYKLGLDSKGIKLPEHFFNISTTVVEDVFRTGQSKFIEGAQSDTNNNPSKSILRLALQTILCSPLVTEDKKIGVIYVDSKFLHKINSREILYTFEILAGQAAIAIRNAQLYQDLAMAKEKAEESNRLKTAFLSQMSHEIRTPINIILNYNTLIRDEFQNRLEDRMKFVFDGVENSGNRLIRTLDNILNMSSLQSGNFEINFVSVDLLKILKNVMYDFENIAESKKIDISLVSNISETDVECDEYTIVQIFQNLLDNALKYTHEGEIVVTIYRDNNMRTCVDIRDTGIGISNDYLPKIFNPFSQEEIGYSRAFDGSGLGLALVKKYAELNNFEIEVDSSKGQGTTFTIKF